MLVKGATGEPSVCGLGFSKIVSATNFPRQTAVWFILLSGPNRDGLCTYIVLKLSLHNRSANRHISMCHFDTVCNVQGGGGAWLPVPWWPTEPVYQRPWYWSSLPIYKYDIRQKRRHIDRLVEEKRSSSTLAMELCLFCTNPSICNTVKAFVKIIQLNYIYRIIWKQQRILTKCSQYK